MRGFGDTQALPIDATRGVRDFSDDLSSSGGEYSEVILADCGHSPHIEKQAEVLEFFTDFIAAH